MTQPLKLVEAVYRKWSNSKPLSIVPLPESGSYRTYYRIQSEKGTVLGVHNGDKRENQAFIYLSNHLKKTGNLVPQVLYADLENHTYFEEDLGNVTLFDHLGTIRKRSCTDEEIMAMYRNVIDAMPGLQIRAYEGLDYSQC